MPSPPCMVIHCPEYRSDPQHEVHIDGEGRTCPVPVCATHKRRIDQGEPWLWVPWNRLKGVGSEMSEGCVLMGEELAGYGLVVDADVQLSTSLVFSPVLAAGRETTTLTVDGRLFGTNQPVSLELVLEPETVARLKEALRFIRP
ncbi:MAG: hypothetical protein ACRDRA_00180 [Pseudonocardiaceae bacterium]